MSATNRIARTDGRRRRRRLVIALLSLALGAFGTLVARPAGAQTSFPWPSDTGDIERYTTPEDCLAAVQRVEEHVEGWDTVWADTLALTPSRAEAPPPAAVTETARRCGARFDAATVQATEFTILQPLYLFAGRDADVATLLHRRLKGIAPGALRERAAVLDSAVSGYVFTSTGHPWFRPHPARLAVAESLLVEANALPDSVHSIQDRIESVFRFLTAAERVEDTARVRRVVEWYVGKVARDSAADGELAPFRSWAALAAYRALVMVRERELLDTLRHGTRGFVALKRAMWAQASGERPDALTIPIGRSAPPVEGTFWFGRTDASTPRPTRGKVALVAFLDYECRSMSNGKCWPTYAALHRLAQRFPALEVTIVARTHGYFSEMAPPTPEQEAAALRDWWQGFHHLPGALAVTTTQFWRLGEPDRRRIDRPTPNETHYSFGRSWEIKPGMTFLVDRDGTIVDAVELGVPETELQFDREVEVLMEEAQGGTGTSRS
ncbi:MAG TPA: hypothetical protein VFS44_12930 [Gemmatimonadaceae bacterium]|nr:hypothetical protein [Gemmatimonadaceae bacterium]